MKIGFGNDHAGVELKQLLMKTVEEMGHEAVDYGYNGDESVDYPIFSRKTAEAVASMEVDYGVVICGTGIGISIAANKVKGVRAALCTNELMATLARQHNKANVLALGARILGDELAIAILKAFLSTEFEGGRHQNRVNLIEPQDI